MKKIIILIISMLLATVAAQVYAAGDDSRVRGYGFHMLEEPVNPRNVAMGSAGTALGGFGFRYYNPVMPFFSASPYIVAEFGQLPGELTRGGFETALMYPEWFSAVSFHTSSTEFQTMDERGFGASASFTTTIGSVAAGYVRDNVSAGVAMTMAEERIWVSSNYTAFALSAGLGYKMLGGKLNLGAAGFHGIGRSRGLGDDTYKWREGHVPRFARGGAAWSDTLASFPYTIAADVVYHDEDGSFSVPAGIEVKALPFVTLRVGKRFGWETEVMSFGIGLNMERMSFDAAFVPSVFVDDYEMKWGMSFTYRLGGKFGEKRTEMKFPPVKISAGDDDDDGADADAELDSAEVDSIVVDSVAADSAVVIDSAIVDVEDVGGEVIDVIDNATADDDADAVAPEDGSSQDDNVEDEAGDKAADDVVDEKDDNGTVAEEESVDTDVEVE